MTLVVSGVLLAVGVPLFSEMVRDARLTTSTNHLLAALFYTRSEAITRNTRVTLCTSRDQQACTAGADWHDGWIVFHDRNGNGLRDGGETLVRADQGLPSGIRITGNSPVRNHVSYTAAGTTQTLNGGLQMGTITLCSAPRGRQIVINAAGRPRLVRDASC